MRISRFEYKSSINQFLFFIKKAGWPGYLLLASPILSFLTFRQRAEGFDAVDTSALIQIIYTLVIFSAACVYLRSGQGVYARKFLLSRPTIYLLLFILVSMLSALWSNNPQYTGYMAFQCLANLLLLAVIADKLKKQATPQEMIEWILFWMVWVIFWGAMLRINNVGIAGFLDNPFQVARLETGIVLFLGIYISRNKITKWIVAAFALLSGSNKMYAAMLPGVAMGAFSRNWKVRIVLSLATFLMIGFLIYEGTEAFFQETVFRGRAGVGIEFTTGRDRIWTDGLELFMENPVLGKGFVSAEREFLQTHYGPHVISMHNMLLSAGIGVGVIGPILMMLYVLETMFLCVKKRLPRNWKIGFLATVIAAFLFSMVGPGLGGRVYGAWIASVFVMTIIIMICKTQQSQKLS